MNSDINVNCSLCFTKKISSPVILKQTTTVVKSTHSLAARRQNSRLRAFSSECGPETEMVQTKSQAMQYSDTDCTGQRCGAMQVI